MQEIILANVITLDPEKPAAEAVLSEGGRIRFVGSRDEARALAPKADIIDRREETLTPGLCDAHIHLVGYGFALERLNLEGTRGPEEVVLRLRKRAEQTPIGEWILGLGYDLNTWDLNSWADSAYPEASWLDAVTPHHPVLLRSRDGHGAWANSLALRLAGLHRDSPDPDGGRIVRLATGEPSGTLLETAIGLVSSHIPAPDAAAARTAARRAADDMRKRGFIAVHTMASEPPEYLRAMLELGANSPLWIWACLPHAHLEELQACGLYGRLGERVCLGGIKFFADGALGSRTAWMSEPYLGASGLGANDRGISVDTPEQIFDRGRLALELGFSPVVHAIGDRANHEVLNVLEKLEPLARQQGIQLRLEHAQHLCREDIGRFAKLNVIASVQPIHLPGDAAPTERLLGVERAHRTYAFRSLLNAGTRLALGSDAPVATPDPVAGFAAAVERLDNNGEPWHADEAMTRLETLVGYTLGAAQAAGWDRWMGKIRSGFVAGFTLWDKDPTDTTARPIEALVQDSEFKQ